MLFRSCYKVTQNDNSAYNYGKGLCCVTVTETPLNTESDKLITLDDGTQVWICDYVEVTPLPPTPSEPNETTDLRCAISGNTNLKNGYNRSYTVTFSDTHGNSVDWQNVNYHWKVVSDFSVKQITYENKIDLFVDDENLVYSKASFLLQIIVQDLVITETQINIVE